MTENVDSSVKERRVLILGNDKESICRTASILLEFDYLVLTTFNTSLAVDTLSKKGAFDILIIDQRSIATLGFLNWILPLIGDIPIVVMSSDFPAESVVECKKRGVVEVLAKPVDASILQHIWQHVPTDKKKRFKWTEAYKQKFSDALTVLKAEGITESDITGKKVWEKMNDKDLTVDMVSSHLRRYKLNGGTRLRDENDTADNIDGTDNNVDELGDKNDDAVETEETEEDTTNKEGQTYSENIGYTEA